MWLGNDGYSNHLYLCGFCNPGYYPKLLEFLRVFRDWTQYIVDEIWMQNHTPSMGKLHNRFYRVLRK